VEEVVAVELETESGDTHFVVTWGRLQHTVDPTELEALVLDASAKFVPDAVAARTCTSLGVARDAPYFYEALIHFASEIAKRDVAPTPFDEWAHRTDAEMREGRHLYYLGHPADTT
jgi:hypothetical protein